MEDEFEVWVEGDKLGKEVGSKGRENRDSGEYRASLIGDESVGFSQVLSLFYDLLISGWTTIADVKDAGSNRLVHWIIIGRPLPPRYEKSQGPVC